MRSIAILFALTVFSAPAIAAAPSGAASAERSPASQLPQKGKVLSVLDAGMYTYVEVSQDKKTLWLAAPAVATKKDDIIRFSDGLVMTNFHSKTLNRDFESVIFVDRAVVTNEKE